MIMASTLLMATDTPVLMCASHECPHVGPTRRRSAIGRSLQADGISLRRSRMTEIWPVANMVPGRMSEPIGNRCGS